MRILVCVKQVIDTAARIELKDHKVDGLCLMGAGWPRGHCLFATAFFTGAVILVTSSAPVFGLELLVPEMRPPSPRPSLVLELDCV
jgi:hypothetical protein